MVFSSILFLLYFLPAFLIAYYLLPVRYRNAFLLCSSVFFYSWGAPRFIFVILFTTVVDYLLVLRMDASSSERWRKAYLVFSVAVNLGLLLYFKYSNFFIENLNVLLEQFGVVPVAWMHLVLPIGISFYTFETITYVMDVYRRVHPPQKDFWNYQLYIIFFPKLIAGPIIRYHEFAGQITSRYFGDDNANRIAGFSRFSIGLGKKVLLANNCGGLADQIMGFDFNIISSPVAWLGILAYTMQIYFDFSGYSDMAIGLGRMLGFKIPENFDNPYTSRSITEFWRRWHITLGSWMRNYLYIPLGGNRVQSPYRLYMNLFIVFLASGLWHGASWNFIFWGAYHGFFLVIERLFLLQVYRVLPGWLTVPLCFCIVMIGWVFFRIESFGDASLFVSRLFSSDLYSYNPVTSEQLFYIILALIFSFISISSIGRQLNGYFFEPDTDSVNRRRVLVALSAGLFILSLSSISSSGFNPFIYFRF